MTVLDRANEPEILTFGEAQADKTLDEVRDRILEKYYTTIREKSPEQYQREDKSWKSFSSVRDAVADQYFEKLLQALEPTQKTLFPHGDKTFWSKDQAASLRFYAYLKQLKEQLEKDPTKANQWVKAQNGEHMTSLKERAALADQWKVEKQAVIASRQAGQETVDPAEALELQFEAWSTLKTPSNGDLTFFQVKERGTDPSQLVVREQEMKQVQSLLGNEAQRHLMSQVLQELKNKDALSLAYLKIPQEEQSEPDNVEPTF
jgi:hypothetical protein